MEIRDKGEELKKRTKKFAIEALNFSSKLPKKRKFFNIIDQLNLSACSVEANYWSAYRAKSKKDFISKLSIVIDEADECFYWFELLESLDHDQKREASKLKDEANQLAAIMVASSKKAKGIYE